MSGRIAGHARARARSTLALVLLGGAGSWLFAAILRMSEAFSVHMLAPPVTAGAAVVAAGVIQCDRAPGLDEFYDRAVRSRTRVTWVPRLVVLLVGGLAVVPASTGSLSGDWGVLLVIRNVLLLTSWSLAVEAFLGRPAATATPALWAGTLVVSSSAPEFVAPLWRLPLAPASSRLGWLAIVVAVFATTSAIESRRVV